MGKKTRTFFEQLISERDPKSARRFVTLIISALFILTCLTILVLLICLFLSTAKLQGVNIEALKIIADLLKDIVKYEAFIMMVGLMFIAAPKIVSFTKAFLGNGDSQQSTDPTTVNAPKID